MKVHNNSNEIKKKGKSTKENKLKNKNIIVTYPLICDSNSALYLKDLPHKSHEKCSPT